MSESADPESLNLPQIPKMEAEAGYELNESAPLRVTGFLSLLLGAMGVLALLGKVALLFPIASLVFGIFALRRHGSQVPVGTGAAKAGIILSVFFGSCGFFMPWMKSATLGAQAEKFGRDYIELVARDEAELALQLMQRYDQRFPTTMPLKTHYELTQPTTPDGEDVLVFFRNDGINQIIRRRGPNAEWSLGSPTEVYTSRGFHKAVLVFVDPSGKDNARIRLDLEYQYDREGEIQWHVQSVKSDAKPIYAPSVL